MTGLDVNERRHCGMSRSAEKGSYDLRHPAGIELGRARCLPRCDGRAALQAQPGLTHLQSYIIVLLLASAANAEPQPQPQPKVGAVCPSGYQSSGGYCVPRPNNKWRMMPKLTATCPVGYTASFDYCVETGCSR